MNTFEEDFKQRKADDRRNLIKAIIFTLALTTGFVWFLWLCAYRPNLIPTTYGPGEEYISPGITKLTIENHSYYKIGMTITHSESCGCKK